MAQIPTITARNQSVAQGGTIAASTLIGSVSDPGGFAITFYDFRDDGGGAGYLTLNGVRQAVGVWLTVTAANLSQVGYVGGTASGSETVDVAAWDGFNWSYYQPATVTTLEPARPTIAVQNETVDAGSVTAASRLITASHAGGGAAITSYDFRDNGSGGGYFSLNGARQAANDWITVAAANLSQLVYVSGSAAASETVDVAAWDGGSWSFFQTATITTLAPVTALPVVKAQNRSVNANTGFAASTLIVSASASGGRTIASYEFRDGGVGGGYLSFNGVAQTANVWVTVSASNLGLLQYVGGTGAGSETVDVAASDGLNWSNYQTATVTTRAILAPVIAVADGAVTTGGSLAASALISSVVDPNNLAILSYEFRDDGGGGGYLSLNDVRQATGAWIVVGATALGQLRYVGGTAAGSETIEVAASNGQLWSIAATATIITKPPKQTNQPVVVTASPTISANQSIQAASLVASVSDPGNLAISYYGFYDQSGNGGYFLLNGLRQAKGSWITVSTANLSGLVFVGGANAGSETINVEVWDGQSWSKPAAATITTQAAIVARPLVTVQNQLVMANGSIQAASLVVSTSDPAGLAISAYDFRDDGAGLGHFSLAGVTQASGGWINVSASQLSQLVYVGGTGAGSEVVDVAVWDGANWSTYQTATITTLATALPVITVQNQTVNASATIQASALIGSVTDPSGTSVTSYQFRDDGGSGGHLSLGGVVQATGSWISIAPANLAQLQFIAVGTAGSETIDVSATDGAGVSAYRTATVTTQGAIANNSVLAQLKDAGVLADATKFIQGDALGYSGLLTLLQDVAVGGVTAAEFADLKTLVGAFNKTNGVQVSSYLAYVTNSLVNGDPSNAVWTGGAKTTSALGNLAVGTSQAAMTKLVGKWLLGSDLPAPIFESASISVAYVADTNPLFGSNGLPSVNDINQGYLGDCYLLASLAEIAQSEPSIIQSMLINNGNGTYGVRFYIQGRAVFVTVDTELPDYTSNGGLVANRSPNIWGALIEKAYVQLNAEPGFLDHPTGNVYKLIDGGWADPITQITGRSVTYFNSASYSAAAWALMKASFAADIQAGLEVDFGSFGDTTIGGLTAFVSSHMFSGLGYDVATGQFIVRNPWGVSSGQDYLTQFEASIADLYSVRGVVCVASSTGAIVPTVTASIQSDAFSVVAAAAGGALRSIPFDTQERVSLAQAALDPVNAGLLAGNVADVVVQPGATVAAPGGGMAGEFIAATAGTYVMQAGYSTALVTATGRVTVSGGAASGQLVIAGNGGLAFNAGLGAGSVFAGDGNNLVSMYPGAGSQNVDLGMGDDTVVALSGDNVIAAGPGHNQILLGSGANQVNSTGDDLIAGGSGAATITAASNAPVVFLGGGASNYQGGDGRATVVGGLGADTISSAGNAQLWLGSLTDVVNSTGADTVIARTGSATVNAVDGNMFVFAGSGKLDFHGGGGASTLLGAAGAATLHGGAGSIIALAYAPMTYLGGGGADTIAAFGAGSALTATGGSGTGLFLAGPSGHNSITGGSGTSIIFGGGDGDVLTAGTGAGDTIKGGTGAETISAAGTHGVDKFYAGTGPELIRTGDNNTSVLLSTGAATIAAGAGVDLYAFTQGNHPSVLIENFKSGVDYITLVGFGAGEAGRALAAATTSGGSERLTLSDGTAIIFQNFSGLAQGNFL